MKTRIYAAPAVEGFSFQCENVQQLPDLKLVLRLEYETFYHILLTLSIIDDHDIIFIPSLEKSRSTLTVASMIKWMSSLHLHQFDYSKPLEHSDRERSAFALAQGQINLLREKKEKDQEVTILFFYCMC